MLKQQGVPPTQRPPKPAPHAPYPTQQPRARRLLEAFKAQHPDLRVHGIAAEALSGTVSLVDEAAAILGGVQVLAPIRSHQNMRAGPRAQHVADYWATHPGTPHPIRIRGGKEVVVWVSRARLSVCSHTTKRFIVAITYAEDETSRDLMASDLSWRTLDIVQGHSLRWLVEVFIPAWKSYAGWRPLTQQPGDDGARPSVILSLLVDHRLLVPPDPQTQLQHHLPAYPVGSLRANVHVECLVEVIDDLVSSDHPQDTLSCFTKARHAVLALGRSTTPMIPRQWGRLEPTPSLKYRAHAGMRHVPVMST